MSYDLVVRNITHTDVALFYDGMVDLLSSHLDWHDFLEWKSQYGLYISERLLRIV